MKITDLRVEYKRSELDEDHAHADPIAQFSLWWDEATAAQVREANAMTLATADADGKPAARTVLLKSFDQSGFVFFTNYESRKGRELAGNPRGTRRERACCVALFLARARAASSHRRQRRARERTRIRRILSQPPSGQPYRRVGLAAEPANSRQGVVDGARGRNGTASRGGTEPAAVLGRLSRRTECDRVLAGTAVAAARSTALYEDRRWVDAGTSRTLRACSP